MRCTFLIATTILLLVLSASSTVIRGEWNTLVIANVITSVPLRITDAQIRIQYNSSLVYGYKLQGNRIITNLISSTNLPNRINRSPSEADLKTCISSFYTYEVKGDMLQIKNSQGKLMAQMRKTGEVVADVQHPVVTSVVKTLPIITSVPIFRDPGILKNRWKVNVLKGITVIFQVEITSTNIIFEFCNKQSLPFTVGDNNKINIENRIVRTRVCEHYYPAQEQVVKAFVESTSYDVNDYFLYMKKGNDINVFLEKII